MPSNLGKEMLPNLGVGVLVIRCVKGISRTRVQGHRTLELKSSPYRAVRCTIVPSAFLMSSFPWTLYCASSPRCSSSPEERDLLASVIVLASSVKPRTCSYGNLIQMLVVSVFVCRSMLGCSLVWTKVALKPWGYGQWLASLKDSKVWLAANLWCSFPLSIMYMGCSSTNRQPAWSLWPARFSGLAIWAFPPDVEAFGRVLGLFCGGSACCSRLSDMVAL
ncbi:hypothetical protein TIFTF001_021346 [Ficus carica]|uniref:Uncharacterized protein n=1 Tax=Ficus carica TaxID=3494 RepID=A0AA88AUU7_FICCA|nr:hypothetical protein TIFTF001_021346 [Ficus carica]